MKQLKQLTYPLIIISTALIVGTCVYFFMQYYPGLKPVISGTPASIVDLLNNQHNALEPGKNGTEMPLSLPDGFSIDVFATDLPDARVLAMGPDGSMYVSQMKQGSITRLTIAQGVVTDQQVFLDGLQNPHALAFDPSTPTMLYIAEETRISRVDVTNTGTLALQKVVDLPKGGRHVSRTIGFGPDGYLYVSIGSTCDVCTESDPLLGAMAVVDVKSGGIQIYATGLRNSVFFRWHEVDGSLWATEMGRDGLGDDLPPDEINIIQPRTLDSRDLPKNYGWPICYGNKIHDTDFDTKQYIRNPCEDTIAPTVELPAHVAPLGIGIIPESTAWPEEYWYDVIVAEHGSWNRSDPVGYQLLRVKLNSKLEVEGVEPFISGWLTQDNLALGRPVDVLVMHDGTMYVSDDKAGVIYTITYMKQDPTEDVVLTGQPGAPELERIDLNANRILFSGKAPGTMFFEGDAPITIEDESGLVVADGIATTHGDAMTGGLVSFTAYFTKKTNARTPYGLVVLREADPSGQGSAHTYSFPISFSVSENGVGGTVPEYPGSHYVTLDIPQNQFLKIDTGVSPITFTGQARGMMFFEASFPVVVQDDTGAVVAQGIATATVDPSDTSGQGWMSENMVPFTAILEKKNDPLTKQGTVIFHNDNPSGLSEHDITVSYIVQF